MNNANGSTQISKYSYTYYVDGNQKSKEESVAGENKGTTNYTYDGLNRLVQEQTPDKTYSYQYDSYGNRSQLSVTGNETYTTNYIYDKNNRLRNQTKTTGSVSEITDYWYDPNGNQISSMTVITGEAGTAGVGIENAGGNTNSINEYNSWNQLTSTIQNGKSSSYTYDGDGLRMSKTVDGVTTNHIWDGTNIAADVTNGTVTKYIRGIQLISAKTGNNESFYNYNAHGDVVQLTNGSGDITKQYSYDAFGVELNKDVNDTNPFLYCGEYFDKETESVYLRARYYSPVSGRFITEDPIRDGMNWYSYCEGNPVNRYDPTGLTDSMLRYIVEKNGGSIEYDPNTGLSVISVSGFKTMTLSSVSSGKITVSVEGQTDVEIDARIVNGRTIVDSQFLTDNFGISEDQATHQSNDSFASLEDAIVGFGLTYYPKSESSLTWINGCEYGSYLYDNGDETFSFGDVPNAIATNTCNLGVLDTSRTLIGWIHTHPNPGVNYIVEEFSGNAGGNGDGAVTEFYDVPGYLVAPSGTVYGLNSSWSGVDVKVIPASDPNVFIVVQNLY